MRILITGANGFIGGNLGEALGKEHEIVGICRNGSLPLNSIEFKQIDILDQNLLEQLFIEHPFDIVIHLAALTAHHDIVNNKFRSLNLNIAGTRNLLDLFIRYCKNSLFIYSSTGKVYGRTNEMPVSENAVTNPTNILGKSKLITEKVVNFYANYDENNQYVVLRIFNVFGAGQKQNFIIPTLIKQMKESLELQLGNIDDQRDYLYIKDLNSAFLAAINNYKAFQHNIEYFNIGSGKSTSVKEIISILEKLLNQKFIIKIDPSRLRQDETAIEYANISKFNTMTGWKPCFTLEEGLKSTLEGRW